MRSQPRPGARALPLVWLALVAVPACSRPSGPAAEAPLPFDRVAAHGALDSLATLVDAWVTTGLLARGVPGVSVVITRGDETLVQRAWGLADVAGGRAADPATVYRLASTSKQFTAVLVLKLVERGRLSLDDPIGRYLTGLRPAWEAITIGQLLNHTAGLPRSYLDPARIEEHVPGDSLVAWAARDPMAAPPGTTFLYSNTGYMLLGVLVEKCYGKPYGAALRDEIAQPLGLTTLRPCGDTGPGHTATGYHRAFDGTLSAPAPIHPSQSLGAGGLCATAGDVAAWNRALHGGRVLTPASYAAMTTPRGAAIPAHYGFGLHVRRAPWGSTALTHGGQTPGFTAENGWYPAASLSVTILYNAFPRVADGGTHPLAALALGHRLSMPDPAPQAAATPATAVAGDAARRQFVGAYELAPGAVFRVTFEEGAFYLTPPRGARQPLMHEAGATYAVGSAGAPATATFLADAEGRVVGFLARQAGVPDRRLRKVR